MSDPIPVDAEIVDLLESVSRRVRWAAHRELEPLGLTPGLARALRVIGRSPDPLRMSDVADHLRIARRSATSVIDELAERGLICRCADPADRRAVTVDLTDAGRTLLAELRTRRRAAGTQIVAALPQPELLQLRDLLRRIDVDRPVSRRAGM
jgi:DNA-binding MarR family transcriptional regulator